MSNEGFTSRALYYIEYDLHNTSSEVVEVVRWYPIEPKFRGERKNGLVDALGWAYVAQACNYNFESALWLEFLEEFEKCLRKFRVQFQIVKVPDYHFEFRKSDSNYSG